MKVANIRPFEGHPFAVRDNKDMWDLVDSIKKFGVLEPVMVIPHKDGGYGWSPATCAVCAPAS